jgi:hypothetical protein
LVAKRSNLIFLPDNSDTLSVIAPWQHTAYSYVTY